MRCADVGDDAAEDVLGEPGAADAAGDPSDVAAGVAEDDPVRASEGGGGESVQPTVVKTSSVLARALRISMSDGSANGE